jgi:hypothetical protein
MLPERGEDTASGEHMTKRTHRSHSPAFKPNFPTILVLAT